jgi:Secretion system C-terminal sorting domain
MKSDLAQKIQAYSVLAIPIIATAGATDAQIIHSDFKPDVILDKSGNTFFLDLNADGINDFELRVNTFTHYFTRISGSILASALRQNSIAGSGSSSTFLPFALNSGQKIGKSLQWNKGNQQYLVGFYLNQYDNTSFSIGNWAPMADSFIGLRFQDNDSVYHYGWLRAQTYRSGDSVAITLKDYAYQAIGDSSIVAGDTGKLVSGIQSINNGSVKITYFNHEVYISSSQNSIGEMAVEVFDLEGRRLLEYNSSQKQYQFSTATLPPGLFLVRVTQSGKTYTKKISLR